MIRVLLIAAFALAPAGPALGQGAVSEGRALYVQGCVSCHGVEAEGVDPSAAQRGAGGISGAGPSLRGVGARSAHFYLTTGYMPLAAADDQPTRDDPPYTDEEIDALIAYIGALGGPPIPEPHPERGSLAQGLKLYTEYCAGCHQIVGEGGVVTGAVAYPLKRATAVQIAEAVRIGPYLMPQFPESQVDDHDLDSIIRYIEYTKRPDDRGGWAIGHLGPIPEGIVAWLIAGTALVLIAVLIGERMKKD